MSVKINYLKKTNSKNLSNQIFFTDEKFNISGLKKFLNNKDFSYINDLLKTNDLKKNLLVFEISSKRKIILISIKNKANNSDFENLGAELYVKINYGKNSEYIIFSESSKVNPNNFLGYFLHGFRLKSYEFKKYITKKESRVITINVSGNKNIPSPKVQSKFRAIEEGTFFARDLVSEPGNVLHPDEYSRRLSLLRKDGLKVNIYDEKKLKKLGMHALLGVGQGSIRGSYLVTLEWKGRNDNSKPLGFVGKGVCFDTGGYSLKPAKFMEDMTYDMAGSATVVGLMKNFALR